MNLTFDEAAHKYQLDGRPIPSVTQIIKEAGLTGHYKGTAARDRGTRIHTATEVYDTLGVIMDTAEAPYVEAWAKFRTDNKVQIIASEQAVCNKEHWYAGTLDRIISLIVAGFPITAILDIKSGTKADWHRFQLGAYALCWPDPLDIGIVLYLKPYKYEVKIFQHDQLEVAKNHWLQIRRTVV